MLKYLCKRASCTRLMSFKLADKSLMSLSQVLNVIPKPLLLCTFDALPRPRVFREVVDAQKFVVAQEKARKIKKGKRKAPVERTQTPDIVQSEAVAEESE